VNLYLCLDCVNIILCEMLKSEYKLCLKLVIMMMFNVY
jgi:hypothetical protein